MTELKFGRVVTPVNVKAEGRTFRLGLEAIESGTGRLVARPSTDYEGDGLAFEVGDVLFGKLRPYLAKVWLADRPGAAVGDFHVYRAGSRILPEYLRHVLLARNFLDPVVSSVFGAKMPRADWGFIRNVPVHVPGLTEQQAIVGYLDRETSTIDALIEEQRGLVEVLSRASPSGRRCRDSSNERSSGATPALEPRTDQCWGRRVSQPRQPCRLAALCPHDGYRVAYPSSRR